MCAPFPIETTLRFARALSKLADVRLLGIVHTAPDSNGPDGKLFADVVRVTDPLSPSDVLDGVRVLKHRHGEIHRLVGILEPLMVPMALAREHFNIAGTSSKTAALFRDKAQMKDALRAAGLPVARHCLLVDGDRQAREFARRVGFPLVLKPPAGMGAKATFRVNDEPSLVRALEGLGVSESNPVLAEEFLQGREFSMETVTLGGKPRVHSFSQYLPSCLEVLENPWIQWACLLPREIDSPLFEKARRMGFAAIEALGLDDGMTHMEWFERPDGSLAIGEIAQRPPGANISLMTGLAHGVDPYRTWARAVVDGELDAPWRRQMAVGCAYLRGVGHGRVSRVTGVQQTHDAIANYIFEAKLPTLGAMKSDSYEGDGYVVVRHERTDVVSVALRKIVDTIRVHYAS